jgi:hypothetical protein
LFSFREFDNRKKRLKLDSRSASSIILNILIFRINHFSHLDDEPLDGPNQYIYLSGFYSIGLLPALNDLEVRIDTITNVSCDSLNETKRLFDEINQREKQEQTLKADVLKDISTYSILMIMSKHFSP